MLHLSTCVDHTVKNFTMPLAYLISPYSGGCVSSLKTISRWSGRQVGFKKSFQIADFTELWSVCIRVIEPPQLTSYMAAAFRFRLQQYGSFCNPWWVKYNINVLYLASDRLSVIPGIVILPSWLKRYWITLFNSWRRLAFCQREVTCNSVALILMCVVAEALHLRPTPTDSSVTFR